MPPVGFETWYPKQCPVNFVVQNIAPGNKRVHVFHYPIGNGLARDLMAIPYVSEADIKHSLLKGELYIKLLCRDIRVIESSIDLITFDECHKNFLKEAGITIGLDGYSGGGGGGSPVRYLFRQNVQLLGPKNNSNRIFVTPYNEKFIDGDLDGNDFRIIVDHNGRRLIEGIDYTILESVPGLGYDMVRFDSFIPNYRSQIIADYVVFNPNGSGGGGGGVDDDSDYLSIRELASLVDQGPFEGFPSGSYKEILPAGDPFPTSVTWYASPAKTQKIYDKLINKIDDTTTIITYNLYAPDGINIMRTSTDTVTYSGAAEISRTRTIT